MLISFLRSLILYLIVIFGLRIMGKRQLGQLQPSELVITIPVSYTHLDVYKRQILQLKSFVAPQHGQSTVTS